MLPACPLPLPIQAILILGIGNGLVRPATAILPLWLWGSSFWLPPPGLTLAALVPGEFGPSGVGAAVFQMGLRRRSEAAVPEAAECPT